MTTAVSYIRMSLDHEGRKLGVARQRAAILGAATAGTLGEPVTLANEYCDNARSATRIDVIRESYTQLITDVLAGQVSTVVVYSLDRLLRREDETGQLLNQLQHAKRDLTILQVTGAPLRIGYNYPQSALLLNLTTAIAAHEVRMKSHRQRLRNAQNRQAGLVHRAGGNRRYGYTPDMQVIPAEATQVRWMADQVLAGRSVRSVAMAMRDKATAGEPGAGTVSGALWHTATVRNMLRRSDLAGLVAYRGAVLDVAGQHPPILDRVTWERLQVQLRSQRRGNRSTPSTRLLSGMVTDHLGHSMQLMQSNRQLCYGVRADSHPGAVQVTVKAGRLEALVESQVLDALRSWQPAAALSGGEVQQLEGLLTTLDAQAHDVAQRFARKEVPYEAWVVISDSLQTERIATLQQLGAARQHAARAADVLAHPAALAAQWGSLDMESKRQVLRRVVDRVVVHPGRKGSVFDPGRVELRLRGLAAAAA